MEDALTALTLAEAEVQPESGLQVRATGTYASGATRDLTDEALWSTSDASVAVVSSTGLISGVSQGTVTVTARVGSVSGSLSVTQR